MFSVAEISVIIILRNVCARNATSTASHKRQAERRTFFYRDVCGNSPIAVTFFFTPFAAAEVCGRVVTVIVASVSFAVPSSAEGDDG